MPISDTAQLPHISLKSLLLVFVIASFFVAGPPDCSGTINEDEERID